MATGTEAGSATLEDFVASALDGPGAAGLDFSSGETPQSADADSAAGAPPAEPTSTTDETLNVPEGAKTGEAQVVDNTTDPAKPTDAPDNNEQSEEDPLADAQPLSYTVDGESRTFDDIKVLAGKGAVISEEALPKLQQRLSERDHLYEASREQYRQYQELERLTAWRVTGQDGKEQTLTGTEGLAEQRVMLGRALTELNVLSEVFKKGDPLEFIAQDENGNLVWNRQALDHLATRSELAAKNAEDGVRANLRGLVSEAQRPPAIDADVIRQNAAAIVEGYQHPSMAKLTADDKAVLAEVIPNFVRPATAEDVKANPNLQLGSPVVDASFGRLVERQAQLQTNTAKAVSTATTVTKENEARLKQALIGKPVDKPNTRQNPAQKPEDRAQDAGSLFSLMEQSMVRKAG